MGKTKKIKQKFFANIQSKDKKEGRKVIELGPDVRELFAVGAHVKVTVEST